MEQLVWVTEPVGVAWSVPTSPVMVPSVQVTAALASTAKLDAAPFDDFPSPSSLSLSLSSPPLRSADSVGPDRLERFFDSVVHAAASSAANDATTASRAVSRGRVNMVPPSVWWEHRRGRGSMSLSDLARPLHRTCQRGTRSNIRRRDENRFRHCGRARGTCWESDELALWVQANSQPERPPGCAPLGSMKSLVQAHLDLAARRSIAMHFVAPRASPSSPEPG